MRVAQIHLPHHSLTTPSTQAQAQVQAQAQAQCTMHNAHPRPQCHASRLVSSRGEGEGKQKLTEDTGLEKLTE